jgi:hypothetical protein
MLAGFRRPASEIVKLILNEKTGKPIHIRTFEKVFASELASGPTRFAATVAHSAYSLIERGNPACVIFALKNAPFFWSDRTDHNHFAMDNRNPDQSEVNVQVHFVSAKEPVTLDQVAEAAPAGTPQLEDMRPEKLDQQIAEQRLQRLRADQELLRLERLRSDRTLVPPLGDREWPGS